jgi:hypothetical protein
MKPILNSVLCLALVFVSACSGASQPALVGKQPAAEKPAQADPAPVNPTQAAVTPVVSSAAEPPVLLFGIGMHIEPFGATPSALVKEAKFPPGQAQKLDYNNPVVFQHHVDDITRIAEIIEAHGGVMTVQAQTPFT